MKLPFRDYWVYTGIIKGSKTLDFQFLTMMFVGLETNLNLVEIYLAGNYGWVSFVIIMVNIMLRFKTTKPLGKKIIGTKNV